MTGGQRIVGDDTVIRIFDTVYPALRDGQFSAAIDALERIIQIDVDCPGASSTLKCAGFWKERLAPLSDAERLRDGTAYSPNEYAPATPHAGVERDGFERGELLLAHWRLFQAFVERLADVPERCLFAIKQFVFTSALACYLSAAPDAEQGGDPDLLLQLGRCCKGIGNYERAIMDLERANLEKRDDARILADLADCYALVNESRAAKVFFREAFFVDPQAIDLAGLESPLIQRLAARLRGMGRTGLALNEWMPVYGVIWGVFSVKREMKPLEFGKLKQGIYQLEKECRTGAAAREALVPRLLNRYFWLIDHYLSAGEPRERIEEVLARIRELDPAVYRDYTS